MSHLAGEGIDRPDDHIRTRAVSRQGEPLLQVRGLRVGFPMADGYVDVVRGTDLEIHRGEVMAVIGESGSGKSVTAAAIMGILPSPPARVVAESIRFLSRDLLSLTASERRKLRGEEMALVLQDSLGSLNPVMTVGRQVAEMFTVHRGASRGESRRLAIGMLERVGIPSATERFDHYPHEFSGGMRQRAVIAMGIALGPSLLIADEPTTALDVTVQAQILDLLAELQSTTGMSMILITHDLAIASAVSSRIAVMYAGRIVEGGPTEPILRRPAHPYTTALLDSRQRDDAPLARSISGEPPDPAALPTGCTFEPRCSLAIDECRVSEPPNIEVNADRFSACYRALELRGS